LEDNYIKLVDLKTNKTTIVVSLFDLTDVSDPNTQLALDNFMNVRSGTWTTARYLEVASVP
jgi:hypothetical protein